MHSVDGARAGERIDVGGGITVGRGPGGTLRADDRRMSRAHARIAFDARAGAYRLRDEGSYNGTFVNARRVTTCLLADGDVVRAGDTLCVFRSSDPMAGVLARAAAVAPTSIPVLVCGEAGTGKELLARSLHAQSRRPGPFVAVSCAVIPADDPGPFLGSGARSGIFPSAHRGTLLLDDVAECPLPAQAAIVRALDAAAKARALDVRVVASTPADLGDLVARGAFRADLYARVSRAVLRVPPLRSRRHEIVDLARAIAAAFGRRLRLTADVVEALLVWPWPLNVRELHSLVQSFFVLSPTATVFGIAQLRSTHPEIAAAVSRREEPAPERAGARRGGR